MRRLRKWLGPGVAAALFGLALWAVHRELAPYKFRELIAAGHAIGAARIVPAMLLAAAGYFVLTLYDAIALRQLGLRLPLRRTSLAAFVSYAFSNSMGFVAVTGTSVRFRLYSTWGLAPPDIGRLVLLTMLTFWLGFTTLAGTVFSLLPEPVPAFTHLPGGTTRPLGVLLLGALTAWLVFVAVRHGRAPLTVGGHEIPVPRLSTTIFQIAASVTEWLLAAGVLYLLLPQETGIHFIAFVGVFLLAQFGGVVSQLPGGIGVFESLIIVLLGGAAPTPALLASLLVYRIVYYLMPLVLAAALFSGHELTWRWPKIAGATKFIARGIPDLMPAVLTYTTFACGVVLLVSGATPAEAPRIAGLRGVLPLPLVEASHFLASLTGLGLLLLARGLQLRLDAAYGLSALLLGAGAVFSLAKGLDYEEAIFLVIMLALLLPCRKQFYRRASLLAEPFDPGWAAAVLLAVGATAWIAFFAHQHVEFTSEIWWRFAFQADAPRALRALVGVTTAALLFAGARLLRPAYPSAHPPSAEELERARPIIDASRDTMAHLALLGDKSFLFGDDGRGFIMYGAEGPCMVALGDPVADREHMGELAWRYRELCDREGAWTVFYQVSAPCLPVYLDLGLTLAKLGEEARVDLETFSMQGNEGKGFRHARNSVQRAGATFEVVAPGEVPALIPQLRQVSDAWLAAKGRKEKGFSMGFFSPSYLSLFPVAVLRVEGAVVAFANIWRGAEREELSVDLMRFGADAPKGSMEALFIETMLWGKEQGYRWFNLGMAPLSGLEARNYGPVWNRVGGYVFRHGEQFYNFQGLRLFKEKFSPVWSPRYLAYPGGLVLPRILIHIASLTSGGLKGVWAK